MKPLQDFITYIRIERRYSPHTVRAYADDIGQFAAFAGVDPDTPEFLNLSRTTIRSWIVSLVNASVNPGTVRRKAVSLRSFFKYNLRKGYIEQNPADGLALPRLSKHLPDFVNETAIEFLFDEVSFPDGFSGLRDRLVLELFYATGMRLSEMVSLQMNAIDFGRQEIKVIGKRNKERAVPMTQRCSELICQYRDAAEDIFGTTLPGNLILTDKGMPAYPRMIQRLVRHYLTAATSLEKRSPHTLRHTFATHMLNNGAELSAVKELLGHANLAATEIYTHNTYEKLKHIYKQAHPRA